MGNCRNRFGIALAAAVIVLFTGIHGPKAQDQAAMFADADGLEPPDAGVGYALPSDIATTVQRQEMWPELKALLSDPDGLIAPNMGFAYDLPADASVDTPGLVFDADGLEPPDIGMAYTVEPVIEIVAERGTQSPQ